MPNFFDDFNEKKFGTAKKNIKKILTQMSEKRKKKCNEKNVFFLDSHVRQTKKHTECCHGFRLTKRDDYVWVDFDHFLIEHFYKIVLHNIDLWTIFCTYVDSFGKCASLIIRWKLPNNKFGSRYPAKCVILQNSLSGIHVRLITSTLQEKNFVLVIHLHQIRNQDEGVSLTRAPDNKTLV